MNNTFIYKQATLADFRHAIDEYGWVVYEKAINQKLISDIIAGFESSYLLRREIQKLNGIEENMEGTLHHLLEKDNFAIELLGKLCCHREIRDFLGGNYILNGINGVINSKKSKSYIQNVHRDVRTFSGENKYMIQMIIVLDDFTIFNGATHFLSGSHKLDIRPDEKHFKAFSKQAVAKKGSIILFDSNLWHAGGINFTRKQRRALTLGFTKPYIKQQFDYPRFLGYEYGETLDSDLRQIIGYNARVPASLQEYYQPREQRMYKSDQG
ncbi:phytanoyl-CoA dioxygenase family protein [Pedobacter rhizosphaerae]|uniref:Ectoine hydroxylase-related dioxygenase, phytanoyl-CoA dioxygenase (PhyH) family n=1 Tax=Pedobacter rhizosphaerae TaxID=390241 RepID=A0A1H9M6A8_9SPHI|nr:phytanoyl-CoA dioxygenase family protein [Pedobacter rhizosphaerae]SER18663.1 Ectoine hydroxylase-related dioxygenase, phytanoyl-CoA dioxygenase (PhyH) family [Pedobacter rhizosphaerae]